MPRPAYRKQLGCWLGALLLAALLVPAGPHSRAGAEAATLPLGDPDLPETRTVEQLAAGVTLLTISRGDIPALPEEIQTTQRGPWAVRALTIDPGTATGHLRVVHGPDLAHTEPTSDLVGLSGAVAGVNGSYFTEKGDYPGDPVGLEVYGGRILSEPSREVAETDVLLDSSTDRLLMGRLGWRGVLRNRLTGAELRLEFLDHPPVVPSGCTTLRDQTGCTRHGDVVLFHPQFSATTPTGYGVEVVLGPRGCVLRRTRTRGTALRPGETSVQATGTEATALLRRTRRGCLSARSTLTDASGRTVPTSAATYGVNGRYRLVSGGHAVAPTGADPFFARHPRTLVGSTAHGAVVLVTIDGRQALSVGATLDEAAAVAVALGLRDAVNLDGGGSTAMSVRGALVNRPSSPAGERPVADALAYVE